MKTIRQLLRRPVPSAAGILLVALLVATLCICVGQSIAAGQTEESLSDLFLTVALPTTNYNGLSRNVPDGMAQLMDSLDTDYPDVVRAVSAPGLASAYISELTPDLYTGHSAYFGWQTDTDGINSMLAASPVGAPYSCAMLEVVPEEILGKTPATAWDIGTQDDWVLDTVTYYCINIRAKVTAVLGLNEGFQDPVGMDITLTVMVTDEAAFEALDLEMGARYLVYGMDYFDMDWLYDQGTGLGQANMLTLTVRNMQELEDLSAEYAVPTIARLEGTAEEFLASEGGQLWQETLENMAVNDRAFPILGVDNLNYLADFALGNTRIVQGRDFTDEELETGAKVCIIAQSLAAANGIEVGDTITLQYYNYDEASPYQYALSTGRGTINPTAYFYTSTTDFVNEGETYTVIGLYRSANEWADPAANLYSFTPNTVFVPKASVSGSMDFSYQGMFHSYVLHNGKMEEFQKIAAAAGFADLFLCDDQGYAAVADSLHDYKAVASRALGIGLCISGMIGALFLALFPLQQHRILRIMADMGATVANRLSYLCRYCLCLLVPGGILGLLSGIGLWKWVTGKLTAQAAAMDLPALICTALAAVLALLIVALLAVWLQIRRKNLMDRR